MSAKHFKELKPKKADDYEWRKVIDGHAWRQDWAIWYRPWDTGAVWASYHLTRREWVIEGDCISQSICKWMIYLLGLWICYFLPMMLFTCQRLYRLLQKNTMIGPHRLKLSTAKSKDVKRVFIVRSRSVRWPWRLIIKAGHNHCSVRVSTLECSLAIWPEGWPLSRDYSLLTRIVTSAFRCSHVPPGSRDWMTCASWPQCVHYVRVKPQRNSDVHLCYNYSYLRIKPEEAPSQGFHYR